jgi:hypothetical protein
MGEIYEKEMRKGKITVLLLTGIPKLFSSPKSDMK